LWSELTERMVRKRSAIGGGARKYPRHDLDGFFAEKLGGFDVKGIERAIGVGGHGHGVRALRPRASPSTTHPGSKIIT